MKSFEEIKSKLEKVIEPCDSLIYFDCFYGLAVVGDECFNGLWVFDYDVINDWAFVCEFPSHECRQLHDFIETVKKHRSPFDSDGDLKSLCYLPF